MDMFFLVLFGTLGAIVVGFVAVTLLLIALVAINDLRTARREAAQSRPQTARPRRIVTGDGDLRTA